MPARAPPTPRTVRFVGRGMSPWGMLAAVLVLLGPAILSPLIVSWVAPTEHLGPSLAAPSLCWGALAAAAIVTGVVRPLRRRRLVAEGLLVPGEVVAVEEGRGRRTVTVAYTPPGEGPAETVLGTTRPASPGDPVQVACRPGRPGEATVVDLGDWALGPPPAGSPRALTLGPVLLLMALLAVAMAGLTAGFAGPELRHERVLAGGSWLVPASLLAAAAAAAWSVRRSGLTGLPALWRGVTFLAVPLALLGGAVGLGALLPAPERPLVLEVEASFCLHPGDRRPICLLDLRAPPELAALRRVRHAGPALAPGTSVPVVLVRPVLGPARVRSEAVDMHDWHPEGALDALFIDKRTRMADLLRAGQVTAEGELPEGSPAAAELERLGIRRLPGGSAPAPGGLR